MASTVGVVSLVSYAACTVAAGVIVAPCDDYLRMPLVAGIRHEPLEIAKRLAKRTETRRRNNYPDCAIPPLMRGELDRFVKRFGLTSEQLTHNAYPLRHEYRGERAAAIRYLIGIGYGDAPIAKLFECSVASIYMQRKNHLAAQIELTIF